jgi:hypothetical protein
MRALMVFAALAFVVSVALVIVLALYALCATV